MCLCVLTSSVFFTYIYIYIYQLTRKSVIRDKVFSVCASEGVCMCARTVVVLVAGTDIEVVGCQTGGLQMPVRLRVRRSLPLTEYPFRVNELGQSLHVRLQLGLTLGRSKRSVLFTWCCHANEPTHT